MNQVYDNIERSAESPRQDLRGSKKKLLKLGMTKFNEALSQKGLTRIILPVVTFIISTFPGLSSNAQRPYEVSVGPGKDADKVFTYRDKYRFPQFQDGYFMSKEGVKSVASK